MNEIKAYIRPERVEAVALALHDEEIQHFTVVPVRSFGGSADADAGRISLEVGDCYTEKTKIEFVCAEPATDWIVEAIRSAARTGEAGDGIVFAYPVSRAVKIRTGSSGREALS